MNPKVYWFFQLNYGGMTLDVAQIIPWKMETLLNAILLLSIPAVQNMHGADHPHSIVTVISASISKITKTLVSPFGLIGPLLGSA